MRDPLLEWFAAGERILSPDEQRAIILRLRREPDRMRERSRGFWLDPLKRPAGFALNRQLIAPPSR